VSFLEAPKHNLDTFGTEGSRKQRNNACIYCNLFIRLLSCNFIQLSDFPFTWLAGSLLDDLVKLYM